MNALKIWLGRIARYSPVLCLVIPVAVAYARWAFAGQRIGTGGPIRPYTSDPPLLLRCALEISGSDVPVVCPGNGLAKTERQPTQRNLERYGRMLLSQHWVPQQYDHNEGEAFLSPMIGFRPCVVPEQRTRRPYENPTAPETNVTAAKVETWTAQTLPLDEHRTEIRLVREQTVRVER